LGKALKSSKKEDLNPLGSSLGTDLSVVGKVPEKVTFVKKDVSVGADNGSPKTGNGDFVKKAGLVALGIGLIKKIM